MKRVLVFAAVGMLGAAGCGQAAPRSASPPHSAPAPAGAVLVSLKQKTSAAGSAKVAFSMQMDAKGIPGLSSGSFKMSGSGSFDYLARRGSMQLDFSGMGSGAMSALRGLANPEMVVDGDTIYMHLPASLAKNAKSWVKIAAPGLFGPVAGGTGGSPASSFGGTGFFGFADPWRSMDLLDGLAVSGTVVGQETVRGVATTHYRTTVDPNTPANAAVATNPSDAGLGMRMPAMPADVWVDSMGRLAKMTLTLDFGKILEGAMHDYGAQMGGATPAPPLPNDVSMVISSAFESYDFGSPVKVTLPPANQVIDAASVPDLGLDGTMR